MQADQSGTKNIQAIGDGHTITQNNYISSLRTKPRDIKVTAHRSFSLWTVLFTSILPFAFMIMGNELKFFNITTEEMQHYAVISFVIISVVAIFVYRYIYTNTHLWYVTYHEGCFIFNNTLLRFYEDIWDIKIRKVFLPFGGAIITIYYIKQGRNSIEEKKIFLDEYAEAKYIYDSFHSGINKN